MSMEVNIGFENKEQDQGEGFKNEQNDGDGDGEESDSNEQDDLPENSLGDNNPNETNNNFRSGEESNVRLTGGVGGSPKVEMGEGKPGMMQNRVPQGMPMVRNMNSPFPGGLNLPGSGGRSFRMGGGGSLQPGISHLQQGINHMQQGVPQGMQQGMTHMQQGGSQGPQGMQQGLTHMQQGGSQVPQGMTHTQLGVPQGMQQGVPQGMPQYYYQKDQSFDMNTSGSFGKKRKREDDGNDDTSEENDEEDSQTNSNKKMKTEEPGNESKGNIQLEGSSPFPPQGMHFTHLPPNISMLQQPMRGQPMFQQPPPYPYPIPKGDTGVPQGMMHMPPQGGWQMPFQNPMMMYQHESIVEVEPFFQQLLLRTPPYDGIIEKLPSSKTPVIDAFIYCSICNWGVQISPSQDRLPSVFTIMDFNKYWDYSQKICSKPSPTETQVARLKALRRWFADFPGIKKIKAVKEGKEPIVIRVKPERIGDVISIVKKYSQIINTRCRSLVQMNQQTTPYQQNMENN